MMKEVFIFNFIILIIIIGIFCTSDYVNITVINNTIESTEVFFYGGKIIKIIK